MKEVTNNSLLTFIVGIACGVLLTVWWNKIKLNRVKFKQSKTEMEFDDITGMNLGNNKLVLVVRNDLKMGKGKVAAQCSHAAVMAHESCRKNCPDIFTDWKNHGQPKIVVKIDSEEEMMDLAKQARQNRLLVSIVQDAGRTQIAPGSKTVLAIGPGTGNLIDKVTGHLKLY